MSKNNFPSMHTRLKRPLGKLDSLIGSVGMIIRLLKAVVALVLPANKNEMNRIYSQLPIIQYYHYEHYQLGTSLYRALVVVLGWPA
jgi:hypothetical protein